MQLPKTPSRIADIFQSSECPLQQKGVNEPWKMNFVKDMVKVHRDLKIKEKFSWCPKLQKIVLFWHFWTIWISRISDSKEWYTGNFRPQICKWLMSFRISLSADCWFTDTQNCILLYPWNKLAMVRIRTVFGGFSLICRCPLNFYLLIPF